MTHSARGRIHRTAGAVPGLFSFGDAVAHNQAVLHRGESLAVITPAQPWAYEA